MKPPRLRAWNQELKMMIQPEEIFTPENIYMLLNEDDDYIWMRSTELFDKDGKEIYEGDVLGNDDNIYIYEVKYKRDRFCMCQPIEGEREYEIYLAPYAKEFELIGNIYQEPELMENK